MRKETLQEVLFGAHRRNIAADEIVEQWRNLGWTFASGIGGHGVELAEFSLQLRPVGLARPQPSLQRTAVLEEAPDLVLIELRLTVSHLFDEWFDFVA